MHFFLFKGMTKTPFEGAKPLINIALNPYYKDTRDAYYIDMRIQQANSLARFVMWSSQILNTKVCNIKFLYEGLHIKIKL